MFHFKGEKYHVEVSLYVYVTKSSWQPQGQEYGFETTREAISNWKHFPAFCQHLQKRKNVPYSNSLTLDALPACIKSPKCGGRKKDVAVKKKVAGGP